MGGSLTAYDVPFVMKRQLRGPAAVVSTGAVMVLGGALAIIIGLGQRDAQLVLMGGALVAGGSCS